MSSEFGQPEPGLDVLIGNVSIASRMALRRSRRMQLKIRGIPSTEAALIRGGGPDANGQPAQVHVASGLANQCRHCLGLIPEGSGKLVLSYRPFDFLQPYAEAGPIFLHEDPCERYESDALPAWFDYLDPAIVRGYGEDHWIRYDTGDVGPGAELTAACRSRLDDRTIAYVHIRSKFGCFQCRVDRA
jgi:hypothetical protein